MISYTTKKNYYSSLTITKQKAIKRKKNAKTKKQAFY